MYDVIQHLLTVVSSVGIKISFLFSDRRKYLGSTVYRISHHCIIVDCSHENCARLPEGNFDAPTISSLLRLTDSNLCDFKGVLVPLLDEIPPFNENDSFDGIRLDN